MIQIFKQNWELGKLESFPILNVIYKHFSRNLQVKMKLLFEIETIYIVLIIWVRCISKKNWYFYIENVSTNKIVAT